MAAPPQPIHPQSDDFAKELDKVSAQLSIEIRKRLRKNDDLDKAVAGAVEVVGLAEVIKTKIVTRAKNLTQKGLKVKLTADPIGFRRFWLNNLWPGEGLTLSARINKLSRLSEIKSTLRQSFKQADSWQKRATSLTEKQLITGDISETINELNRDARRLIVGDPEALATYKRTLKKTQRQVDRLAGQGASTRRLKKAYQSVIVATEKRSVKALDRAMDRSIKAKMNSNAARIARTEMSKAYAQGTYQGAINDKDVIGIRYELSSRHADFDICDYHTGADLFGLGTGVYPLKQLPPYPFHPNCTCVLSNVFRGTIKPQTQKGSIKFLKGLPKSKQQKVMGAEGAKAFRKNNRKWDENLKGFQGHRDINTLRELKGIKEEKK